MQDLIKSKLFWITAIVIAGIVFISGINIQKTYTGETDLLLLPKSEKSAVDFERIIANAEKIPLSLSFYNKLVENRDIEDEAEGLPDSRRKELWNSKIKINRIGKTGIISLEIAGSDQLDAEVLSKQIVREVIATMSRYYNIKNDLDMRIIDGPIVVLKNKLFNVAFFLLSIIIGLIAGMILYSISKLKITPKRLKISFPPMTVSRQPEELREKNESEAGENIIEPIIEKKQPASVSRKAFAPENLPVGGDFVLGALRRSEEEAAKQIKKLEKEKESKTHEATEEEIKRRLNKLLGGQV